MFDFDHWQTVNDEYLASSLAWLRRRLQTVAQASQGATVERFPASCNGTADYQPALEVLATRCCLSEFEKCILLFCASMECDTRLPALCAAAQGDPGKPYPTAALCFSLFADPAWDALSPERPLRRLRLLEIDRQPQQPLTASPLRIDERVLNYLKGLNHLDPRLAIVLTASADSGDTELPPSQQDLAEEIVEALRDAATHANPRMPLVQLLGPHAEDKIGIAAAVARELEIQIYRVAAASLPQHIEEIETFLRLWERECRLLPLGLYVDAQDLDKPGELALGRVLGRLRGVAFCDSPDRVSGSDPERCLAIDVAKPAANEQLAEWCRKLPETAVATAQRIAGHFDLNIPAIDRIADSLSAELRADPERLSEALWLRCRNQTRPKLDELAQRIDCRATWDDIVLPDEDLGQLRQISAQVRHRGKVLDEWGFRQKLNRGLGVTALFAGESGTGKTMAAEVIANDLQLDLYRIDLSSVISKYIGETEKNLRRLFDAAEGGGAILFFDEADALFGKRSEVKDSHDRFANIETNYLLQRMESYRGLAILATNNKSALDGAFTRRLRFIIDFRFPDATQRKAIWQRIFPTQTPLANLDYKHLAKLRLTGGSIQNIALNAAYAAAQQPHIDMTGILEATKRELTKTNCISQVDNGYWNSGLEAVM